MKSIKKYFSFIGIAYIGVILCPIDSFAGQIVTCPTVDEVNEFLKTSPDLSSTFQSKGYSWSLESFTWKWREEKKIIGFGLVEVRTKQADKLYYSAICDYVRPDHSIMLLGIKLTRDDLIFQTIGNGWDSFSCKSNNPKLCPFTETK